MLQLLIDGLAAWRISRLLVYESGPYNILVELRDYASKYASPLGCVYCTSVWIGFLIGLTPKWLRYACAVAAVPALIEDVLDGKG